jgi:hypothetical protein
MKPILASVFLGALLFGAGGGAVSAQTDPQCKLFTPAELVKYIGEPVAAGRNAMGGCQWVTTKTRRDGSQGEVMVVVVPARYHARPKLAKGFKDVPDVGEKGFVAQDMGGWVAGAIAGKDAVKVALDGVTATEANAIALLKETIARHAK